MADLRKWRAGAIESPPTPPAEPSDGHPTNGNPSAAIPATTPGAYWYHQVGEEIRNVILAGGLSPNHTSLNQMAQAIVNLITAAIPGDAPALNAISGVVANNNTGDPDHDLDISPGFARDAGDDVFMVLPATLTKRADAVFSEGNDEGGMVAGESMPTDGTINVWLGMKEDGTVDVFFNDHGASGFNPTNPPDFVHRRRIASVLTDGSGDIRAFNVEPMAGGGVRYWWPASFADLSISSFSGYTEARVATPLTVPPNMDAIIGCVARSNNNPNLHILVTSLVNQSDTAPAIGNAIMSLRSNDSNSASSDSVEITRRVNDSGQVGVRANGTSVNHFSLQVRGYIDHRRV